MKNIFWLLLFTIQFADAQKLKKGDKAILANLEQHIQYLADDKLEGRRTGSAGEKLAYEYISGEFQKAGLQAKGENSSFLQPFEVNEGKVVSKRAYLIINDHDLKVHDEYFPLSFSKDTTLEANASIALREHGSPWFFDIKDLVEDNKSNPHYDLQESIKTQAIDAAKKGANCFFVFNSSPIKDGLAFETKVKSVSVSIPVVYITNQAKETYLKDETESFDIKLKLEIEEKKRTGHNVIGFLNNGAANTIILGAHYDHLGYGEDRNSLHTGNKPAIHNGADDNASGVAGIIELAKLLKASKLKNNNYLFITFSGEELGLFGSKYFTEHPTVSLAGVNYMINMDMIGRLKDSSRSLNIGGYGTSPVWGSLLNTNDKYFRLKFDSSGTGPSDHTSFYRKDIPVLFFFTGTHPDYHKPSDDALNINYSGELQVLKFIYALIDKTNKSGKLSFTKTREMQANTNASFKVTLGFMPDYAFSGSGVRVDGVSAGRTAEKAGIMVGDIITGLNEHKFSDVQGYMEALSKFEKGDPAKVHIKRGDKALDFDIVF